MCEQLLLTVTQAAARLGVGRSKTYELIARGLLPSLKIDGARRVVGSDLVEFVASCRAPGATNIEVDCTHVGMLASAESYRALVDALAAVRSAPLSSPAAGARTRP